MNDDNANQVEVGEDPKAADAALRRMARAQETEAPSDTAHWNVLSDLEVGHDEMVSVVVEDPHELDAFAEDVIEAAANNGSVEAQALTLADIDKIAKTEGAQAADAALQLMARAREAKAREAETRPDIKNVDKLGDLEIGDDTAEGAVVENLGELDAAAENAVEASVARAEAYEAQDVLVEVRKEPTNLQDQMHAARVKYNGGVEVAPNDPFATDKIRLTRYLKKFGRTLDDLPNGFWDEPDEAARGRMLGEIVGKVMANRRFAKRVERAIAAGYPADYYSLPRDKQRKISNAVRQRRWSAKQATKPASMPKPPLQATKITKEWITDSFTRLKNWTAGSDPMAIQLRGREREFVKVRAAYQRLMDIHGRAPKQSELAAELCCSRRVAQNRIDRLRKLESVAGPWHEKC